MANIFASKKPTADKVEEDYIGGGGVFDTDIYEATIKMAYMQKASKSEAMSVILMLTVDGREVRQQIWTTNKSGGVTYKDKNSGEEKNLPGYSQVNALAMVVTGKELGELEVENKIQKIYDYDAKKELNTAVDCFVELHGQKIMVALQRQKVDKTKDDGTGTYVPTGETRDTNEVVKFFPEGKTVTISEVAEYIKSLGSSFDEVLNDGNLLKAIGKMPEELGVYAATWLEKNKGKTYDKSSGKGAEGKSFGGGSKAGGVSAETAKKANDLFD